MSEEKDDNIKINIPLFTNLELEEFDFKLDNYLDSIVQEVSKAVLHDKENILLQKVIQKLQKELEQEKEKNKELENGDLMTVYLDGVYDGVYDGEKKWKDKIRAKIEEYKIKCKDCKFDKYFCKQLNKSYLCSVRNIQKLLQELLEE